MIKFCTFLAIPAAIDPFIVPFISLLRGKYSIDKWSYVFDVLE